MGVRLEWEREMVEEVMVVGLGREKKSCFRGCGGVVDSEDVGKEISRNVGNGVVGRSGGLEMGGG